MLLNALLQLYNLLNIFILKYQNLLNIFRVLICPSSRARDCTCVIAAYGV